MNRSLVTLLAAVMMLGMVLVGAAEDFRSARERMIGEIRSKGPPHVGAGVLESLRAVPRHEFVPATSRSEAYADRPLPIGQGQTISQPYIVALMTELAAVGADSVVLEVGTGSGYQAAVLAELAAHVYTIEIVDELAERAGRTLKSLGYRNITVRAGDGFAGWPEQAPFDAIVVTAAPEQVPAPLIEQLAPGGRLVIPVGPARRTQMLKVLTKEPDGSVSTRDITAVVFVPFTRAKE